MKQNALFRHLGIEFSPVSQIDSFIDVMEDDLLRIYQLATRHTATGNDGSG
jgi:hypothetical protein